MIKASDYQKKYYDIKKNLHHYKRGDAVWLKVHRKWVGKSPKLQMHWEGPYLVVSKRSDLVYEIQRSINEKPKFAHHDHLKKYIGPYDMWLPVLETIPEENIQDVETVQEEIQDVTVNRDEDQIIELD